MLMYFSSPKPDLNYISPIKNKIEISPYSVLTPLELNTVRVWGSMSQLPLRDDKD